MAPQGPPDSAVMMDVPAWEEGEAPEEAAGAAAERAAAAAPPPPPGRHRGAPARRAAEPNKRPRSAPADTKEAVPAAAEDQGPGAGVSGKVLGRRRRAAAKRQRQREERRAVAAAAEVPREKGARTRMGEPPAEPRPKKQKRRPEAEREAEAAAGERAAAAPLPAERKQKKGGGLLDKMREKLSGGRFRWLNEQLYTRTGGEALELVGGDPALFEQYHDGFRSQTRGWPRQPLDVAVSFVERLPKGAVVADFGCGDAQLAERVRNRVHSFDLVASAPGVVACNMANVPLEDGSVDCAVFCLALMGTDYGDFVAEARRVLRDGGRLWIAEVRSRFVDSAGDGGTRAGAGGPGTKAKGAAGTKRFVAALKAAGFTLDASDASDTMFVVFELTKAPGEARLEAPAWPPLKACEYKRR